MCKITADRTLNLLLAWLEGYMTDKQLKNGAEEEISESLKLNKGFVVIYDIFKMQFKRTTDQAGNCY